MRATARAAAGRRLAYNRHLAAGRPAAVSLHGRLVRHPREAAASVEFQCLTSHDAGPTAG
ncbi:conserved hypothetical protein [Burkholderia mallei 2002721280]|nr:conserved hypothetical protein [Burkholderia mallei 2002721280]